MIAVVGPTAAGKSELSLGLALALGGEVVNADSMQLYRGMDIGTAKLRPEQWRGVPHHVLDLWPVTEPASVAEYQAVARGAVDAIAARLARFDHDAIARTKSYVDQVTLPAESELDPPVGDFRELFPRPRQQAQWSRLQELGLNKESDLERSLGRRLVETLPDA